MIELAKKTLGSRKFWAAVVASIPFAYAQDWQSFALVWTAYLTAQGVVDASAAFALPPPAKGEGS